MTEERLNRMPDIIPIFIMNRGCPHRCIFCNERIAAGDGHEAVSANVLAVAVAGHLRGRREKNKSAITESVQLAFYGGNFTGLPKSEQREIFSMAAPYIQSGQIDSIRISTRPDAVDEKIIAVLKDNHVKTVEIGAQSLVDEVLIASRRGHTAGDVARAVKLLRAAGLEVGLHLMIGLPGDSAQAFARSVDMAVALAPDMVRIHPTLVFRDTLLAEAYKRGDYAPLSLEEALESGKYAVKSFTEARISIIRLGLQTTREMEQPGAVVAGPYHPAFGALVASSLYLDQASAMLQTRNVKRRQVTFYVPPRNESAFRGQRNENLRLLTERFDLADIHVKKGPVLEMELC